MNDKDRIAELEKECASLKANHTDLVNRCALLRQRYDLPVDRIPAYEELVKLQKEIATLKEKLKIAITFNEVVPEIAELKKMLNEKVEECAELRADSKFFKTQMELAIFSNNSKDKQIEELQAELSVCQHYNEELQAACNPKLARLERDLEAAARKDHNWKNKGADTICGICDALEEIEKARGRESGNV